MKKGVSSAKKHKQLRRPRPAEFPFPIGSARGWEDGKYAGVMKHQKPKKKEE